MDLTLLIILLVTIGVLLILILLFGIAYSRVCRRNQEDLKNWNKTFLEDGQELKRLTLELEEARAQLHKEDLSEDRDVLNAQKELIIKDIENSRKELGKVNDQLKAIQDQVTASSSALASSQEERIRVENVIHGLQEQIIILERQRKDLETDINLLTNQLNRLCSWQKVIEDNENNVIWSPILSEKEAKLIELLHELINMYPDLKIEFATIEWKKIWMPQLQQLGSTIDGKRGIYRLILKDKKEGGNSSSAVAHFDVVDADGNTKTMPICYVGQAVDIKERWYQHVKKMIGVLAKGNEKVYNYRPEDFYWCIIEEGNDVNLNESEKYWISYYCAKDGLNKKM